MSGGGTETPVACEAAQGGGGKKRDSLGTAGAAHLIIKGTEWRAWSSVLGGGACWGPPLPVLPGSPAALSCLACLKSSSQDPLKCSGRRARRWRMGTSLSHLNSRVTSVLHSGSLPSAPGSRQEERTLGETSSNTAHSTIQCTDRTCVL